MIKKIISGGQTGADRAALDFAIEHKICHGGWCPKGRLAEDGAIDRRYQLAETSTNKYLPRTEKNVKDSDGTVIFTVLPKLTGGSKRTAGFATAHRKPWIHVHTGQPDAPLRLLAFIRDNQIRTLNVAGSRAPRKNRKFTLSRGRFWRRRCFRDRYRGSADRGLGTLPWYTRGAFSAFVRQREIIAIRRSLPLMNRCERVR